MAGYLRSLGKNKNKADHIIPDLVLHICLLFYYQREHFSLIIEGDLGISSNFELSDDKKTISLLDECWGTAYGYILIDSLSEIVCKWNVKLQKNKLHKGSDFTKYIYLGISGDEATESDNFIHIGWKDKLQRTFVCQGQGSRFGSEKCIRFDKPTWNDGDVSGIKLDLQQRYIEYFVNDKSFGIVFQDIPTGEDIKYRLITSMVKNGNCAIIQSHQLL